MVTAELSRYARILGVTLAVQAALILGVAGWGLSVTASGGAAQGQPSRPFAGWEIALGVVVAGLALACFLLILVVLRRLWRGSPPGLGFVVLQGVIITLSVMLRTPWSVAVAALAAVILGVAAIGRRKGERS
jgi:hypothetical protein